MKQLTILLLLIIGLKAQAQSGLDKRQFAKFWQVESESPDYKVTFSGDTCEILSPKGLTLWRKEKMQQGMTVEYDACVVDKGKPGDRLSDMNCFWLASDSHAMGLFSRAQWRSGIFTRCYTLQMYYLGYGGNHNTTTRFRRYDGNEAGVEDASKRPAILKEYTDAALSLQQKTLSQASKWRKWHLLTFIICLTLVYVLEIENKNKSPFILHFAHLIVSLQRQTNYWYA